MSRTRANRQAKYTLLDVTLSLASRCENYPHKLGDGTFDDLHAWLFVRTAEIVLKAKRNQDCRNHVSILEQQDAMLLP